MRVKIADLTDPAAVRAAADEYKQLGRSAFLHQYGYGPARTYFLELGGQRFDSKAIAAVAYGIQYPDRGTPAASDFSGGEGTVAKVLRNMGFRVTGSPPPAAQLSRQDIEQVLAEWDQIGRDAFLTQHRVNPAERYLIEHDGKRYDAKAVVTVAFRRTNTSAAELEPGDFPGSEASIRRPLERLGFKIVNEKSPAAEHTAVWELEPGTKIRRKELHDKFGGSREGGIGPSRTTPNILIFSDPSSGQHHGYFDRWEGEDFHYAGEGKRGNQKLNRGNGALLGHKEARRALRLFWGSKGVVEYAGEFQLDDANPYYWVDAPETGGGPMRKVVTFRLRPVGVAVTADEKRPARRLVRPQLSRKYQDVDPTTLSATPRDPFEVDPDKVDRGLRGHASTQQRLAELAREHGLEPLSPGRGDPNFDIAWKTPEGTTVVEVKSLTAANEAGQIRLGLGQILDYQHSLEQAGITVRAVLALESKPASAWWSQLCARHNVLLVYPDTFLLIFRGLSNHREPLIT